MRSHENEYCDHEKCFAERNVEEPFLTEPGVPLLGLKSETRPFHRAELLGQLHIVSKFQAVDIRLPDLLLCYLTGP